MPQGFQIGPLTIRYYALIILAGALLGAWLASVEAKRRGKDGNLVWDILPWLLVGGIIGARLWHVFTPSASNAAMGLTTKYYLQHPLQILMIWNGGLGIPGAVIGGALALLIYCRATKQKFLDWADIISPGLLIGQAVGRWGNFINQELYGSPSNLPWAITIDPPYRLPGFEAVSKYHPLFLYESLLNLIAAGILLYIGRKYKEKLYKGDIFLLYLLLYPVIRFGLEYLRLDPSPVAGININQTVMGIVALISAALLIVRHTVRRPKAEQEIETEGIDISDMALVSHEDSQPEAGEIAAETSGAELVQDEEPLESVFEPLIDNDDLEGQTDQDETTSEEEPRFPED
ncbi:MAG: prolipoprotein diacylglyceryl transferase [Chloroflexi bacterium]|jgi:phosphatidylglycerol:prolipoprotein diacylglycerol transferase|nr:prolipoprotein diacylglyceryl transferase [Anaerolineaceae bacterium]NLI45363.1 prolipoprotein diacylglyceryl transferase [Chloroflexota bacterium]HOT25001.1 prolipoprotein diacylglyceryl transferase [Anaerolineaceae bacterium]HQK03787.1 prolipoprotein diacylglyceryl transferase [Anaerolineaceae bacterium]